MRSRQYAVVDPQRSDLVELTVVRTDALVEDHSSDLLLGDVIENRVDILGVVRIDLFEMLFGFRFDRVHVVLTLKFIDSLNRFSHLAFCKITNGLVDFLRYLIQFDVHLRLSDFRNDLLDELNDLLDLFVREHDRVEHDVLRNFLRACFYHHDSFLCTGNGHVHAAFGSLRF